MKTTLLFSIFLLAGAAIFAQTNTGISVQGIARDAQKAALVDEFLTFTFEILDEGGGTSYYKEDVDIRTDPYGVFSHIIGTGNKLAGSGEFYEIPFRQVHMKLVISVDYGGSDIVISNARFQYAPYAISADNGVPSGTIVAFMGEEINIPAGWVLCDGRDLLAIDGSAYLRSLLGSDNAPNLQGMFLRGTGSAGTGQNGPALNTVQQDDIQSHTGTTNSTGSHFHPYRIVQGTDDSGAAHIGAQFSDGSGDGVILGPTRNTSSAGSHSHTVSSSTGTETRPVNYGVNYIIKL